MEKVYDIHIHYSFDIPLQETVDIFKEEFEATQTEKYCFMSLPHHAKNGVVDFDEVQNIKGLYLKWAFRPNAYAFAGLVHPKSHADEKTVAQVFLSQAKQYLSVGFDGIKMLEGYPSLVKAWNLPVDSPVYDEFYRFMEENGYPLLMHIANPKENWDVSTASPYAIESGRVYDSSYPTKEELTIQVFRVMDKFPKLKFILAHFGFMSYDMDEAERFLSYPNTLLDITPGGEQLINMQKEWEKWLPFWKKYQDRILYGTDFYAFPKDENWEVAFMRRPQFIRQFLETNTEHLYLDEKFTGICLDKALRNKIYRDNFMKVLNTPKLIDKNYMVKEVKRLITIQNKKSRFADDDLEFILQQLFSEQ